MQQQRIEIVRSSIHSLEMIEAIPLHYIKKKKKKAAHSHPVFKLALDVQRNLKHHEINSEHGHM